MSQQRLIVTHPLVALKSVGETLQGFTEHWREGQRGFGALELGSPLTRHSRQPCEAQGLLNLQVCDFEFCWENMPRDQ